MDLATLIGLIGGFAFVIMAMVLGGSIGMFVDVTSILIVVGGSAFVVLMKFTLGQFFGAA
ncbi:flagellar motor protein PomA, partial [Vibrio parahaemolyticus]|nr:flagellar motor protein PomA [Vibrio parahaemolyticus]